MEGDDFSCPPVRSREWRGALPRWGSGWMIWLLLVGRERPRQGGCASKQRNTEEGEGPGGVSSLLLSCLFFFSIFRLLEGKYRI